MLLSQYTVRTPKCGSCATALELYLLGRFGVSSPLVITGGQVFRHDFRSFSRGGNFGPPSMIHGTLIRVLALLVSLGLCDLIAYGMAVMRAQSTAPV